MAPHPLLARMARSDRGAVFVEFALVLPLLLLLFAVIIEGGRMMWSYQTAIAGVRDAARYVGRVVPSEICTTGEALSIFITNEDLATIIKNSIEGDIRSGSDVQGDEFKVLPSLVEIDPNGTSPVTAALTCVEGTFRLAETPITTVSARVQINFPFRSIFEFAADGIEPFIVTTITDQSRVFGS